MRRAQDQDSLCRTMVKLVACMNGILPRSLSLFPALQELIEA